VVDFIVVVTFLVLFAVVEAFAVVGNVVVTGGTLAVGSGIFPVISRGQKLEEGLIESWGIIHSVQVSHWGWGMGNNTPRCVMP